MKLLRTTALTAALVTAAVMSITSPALAQDWGWGWRGGGWGWPGASVGALATRAVAGRAAVRNYSYGYPAHSYGYPAYGGYGTGYRYPAPRYATSQYEPYSSYGGYGTWNNPWYSAAYHPFIRRHIPLWARATGARRHWQ
jgi:hypothetical protein